MKVLAFLLMFGVLTPLVRAGSIKDLITNHPDQWQALIESGSYPQILQFIKDAYAEYKADPKDAALEYAYLGALDKVSAANPISVSLDFTLNQPDTSLRQIGVHTVYQAVLSGVSINQANRDRLIEKLKAEISELNVPAKGASEYARYAVYTLMLLGDDVGLDDFLTYKAQVRNLSVKDDWDAQTLASHFEQLANQYNQAANNPATKNRDWHKTVAAMYQLAAARRSQGKEVKPLHPTANLD